MLEAGGLFFKRVQRLNFPTTFPASSFYSVNFWGGRNGLSVIRSELPFPEIYKSIDPECSRAWYSCLELEYLTGLKAESSKYIIEGRQNEKTEGEVRWRDLGWGEIFPCGMSWIHLSVLSDEQWCCDILTATWEGRSKSSFWTPTICKVKNPGLLSCRTELRLVPDPCIRHTLIRTIEALV